DSVLSHSEDLTDGENLFVGDGGVANINYYNGKASYSNHVWSIKTKNEILTKYLYYYILKNLEKIDFKYFTGSGLRNLQKDEFKKEEIIFPKSKEEQQKIAEILEKIDNAIEKTDKIINKYKKIKEGLMQDLLTKGIDENGNIRDKKTHKFKDSPLGRIPEEWSIKKDFIKIFSGYGFALKEYSEDGIFLIRIDNIGHGRLIHENFAYLPEKYKQSYERFLINRGDVLLALNRPITREKLKIAKVDLNNAILYQRVGKLLFRNETEKNFYFYYMQSNFFIKQLELSLVGSDQPYITETGFKDLLFKFPPLPEQQRIAKILTQIDNTIEKEQKYKEKLIKIKNGLMEDLLTGKIRVNNLIER
ncbi:restriction endonuclease subunit S, partial [Desulfonauticus submarinus]